mmetsp:Transcript_26893/g.75691  ORF Transcript_26893/g.75691 Transcript_26893/m.75691 type:complete len:223 (-) Transcript_26893:1311-1979(-)
MHSTVGTNREITPNRRSALKLNALNSPTGWLEPFVRVLCRDARRNHMAFDRQVVLLHEINGSVFFRVFSIHQPNFRDVVQGNAHCHLELGSWHVNTSDTLSNRVLHLEARIQLKEVVLLRLCVEEKLHGTSAVVPNVLAKALSRALHLGEHISPHDSGRTFLKDLLEPPLGGTVTAIQCNSVPMVVADNLDFDVPGAFAQLHHKHWRTWDFCQDLAYFQHGQ